MLRLLLTLLAAMLPLIATLADPHRAVACSNATTEAAGGPDGGAAVALAASLGILLAGLGAGLVVRLRS